MSRIVLIGLFAGVALLALACPAGVCWTISSPVASTSQDSLDPRLAVDANGRAYVVWRERVGGSTFQIWYADNVAGGFSAPLEISQGGTIHSSSPVVAVDGTDVHASWARDPASGASCEIWYRRRSSGVWGSTLNASNTSIKSLRPWLSVRGSIGPLVTWDEALYADDNYDVLFSEWTGAGFGSSYNVSNTPGGKVYGSVCSANAISPNGDVTVVWPDSITGEYRLNARRRVGGVWQARQEISAKQTGPAVPGIAVGHDNQVHVVHSAEGTIWYQRWTGTSWTSPSALPGGIGTPLRPKIAVDDQEVAHVVVDNSSYGVGEIYYTNNASGSWSAWQNVSDTPDTNSLNADIAWGRQSLTVTWQENSNQAGGTGVFNVWYSRLGAQGAPDPVLSFTVTPTDSRNTLAWTNPYSDSYYATAVRFKTTGYPINPADGELLCDRPAAPGTSDSFTHTGLINGVTYYYTAFARDISCNYASGVNASGTPWQWSISYAKSLPDGSAADLYGKIVTAVFSADSCFYIEEPDRSSGIRVAWSGTGLAVGDRVDVSGTVTSRKPDGVNVAERQITATSVTKLSSGTPLKPIAMLTSSVGGAEVPPYVPGVLGGIGTNNMGLLVEIAGKVTYKVTSYIYVDEGCGIPDISGRVGVMVRCPSTSIPAVVGDMVTVRGVIEGSIPSGWETNRRLIRMRDWNDLTVVQ